MHTDILTPKELFQKDVRYTIPPFQRPYVWNQDQQWEPLWDDVRNVAESYLEELEKSGGNGIEAEKRTGHHFLGAVVLKQVPTAAKDIDQREVIDGQQRVTTLQLLLDAVQQICEEGDQAHLKRAGRRLSKLVTNDDMFASDDAENAFKLWPTRGDREAFRHAMVNGLPVKEYEDSLIVQAHEFFKLQVKKWLEDDSNPLEERVDALEAAATALLQMVVIDLDSQDDPNLIFETLNARGTPLVESDLIKNFVLARGGDGGGSAWGDLDDRWWRREVRQGRLRRPRLDMLMNYWLAMIRGSEVSPSRVFDTFRDYVDDQDITLTMQKVRHDLAKYREFEISGGVTPREKVFHYRIGVMQAGVITPVMLILLSAQPEPRQGAFEALESFLIRRMICRLTTKDYNRLTLELAGRLQENSFDDADKITAGFLKEQKANAREWPNDDEVAHALSTSPLYRLLTRGRLRLILEGVEARLRSSGKSEDLEVPKNLTIEHVMPVGWGTDNWPLPPDADTVQTSYQRNTFIHTVGNLTLTTQKLNSSMSNSGWEEKRSELLEHATLLLNNELTLNDAWDEGRIHDRSQRIAKLIAEVWPGPDSPVWKES